MSDRSGIGATVNLSSLFVWKFDTEQTQTKQPKIIPTDLLVYVQTTHMREQPACSHAERSHTSIACTVLRVSIERPCQPTTEKIKRNDLKMTATAALRDGHLLRMIMQRILHPRSSSSVQGFISINAALIL